MITTNVFNTRETKEYKELQETKDEIKKIEESISSKQRMLEKMKNEVKGIESAINQTKTVVENLIKYAMTDDDYQTMKKWNGKPNINTSIAYRDPFYKLYVLHSVISYDAKSDCLSIVKDFADWFESKIETMPNDMNPYSPRELSLKELAKVRAEISFIGKSHITIKQKQEEIEQLYTKLNNAKRKSKKASDKYNALLNQPTSKPIEPMDRYKEELCKQKKKLGIR